MLTRQLGHGRPPLPVLLVSFPFSGHKMAPSVYIESSLNDIRHTQLHISVRLGDALQQYLPVATGLLA